MAKDTLIKRSVFVVALLIIGMIIGISISLLKREPQGVNERLSDSPLLKRFSSGDLESAIMKVSDSVGSAVVSISTEHTQKTKVSPFPFRREGSPFHDELFERFFRDFFRRSVPEEVEKKRMGLGSGVVIDKNGYILTNEHVISGADKIEVTFPDGRKFEATLKGSDARSDIAVIKVDSNDLPVAKLGDSDDVRTGQWVVAIGNPFGYIVDSADPTVTAGVISALHRSLPSQKSGYLDLIQTDAAINPGNSGGPLCDLDGNIIGINVAIFSSSGGYQGVGFAIPINVAKSIIEDLKRGRKIAYGWLGVIIQDVTEDLAVYFGLSGTEGVLISEVVNGSPAYNAGIVPGDIIVELDGAEIKSTKELIFNISRIPVDKKIVVDLIRNKGKMSVPIKIGQMPTEEELAIMQGKPAGPKTGVSVERWRGMEVYPVTDEIARRFNIEDKEGVLIVDIERDSPAYSAALREGDVIKSIDSKKIKDLKDYIAVVKGLVGDVLIYTDRGFTIIKDTQ
ncbi:MAG: trypsin-like peptidase domain-containing protein [Candidatus Omnitrophota bacterium]